MRYMIDEKALMDYLKGNFENCVKSEETCKNLGNYELATSYREQRYVFGNLILMIQGDEHKPPVTVEDGGFMKPMTSIRAAVNSMTDYELAGMLSPIYTILDGKLVDCDGDCCEKCPTADWDCECATASRGYMLQEVE